MTVNADDAVTDLPPFKHFLFLYKNLSDDGSLPFSFLAVGQIGLRYIPIFVAGTSYAKLPTMSVDISIEPFKGSVAKVCVSENK